MKVVIAGSRGITRYRVVVEAITRFQLRPDNPQGVLITEVVSGGAKGVDKLGERWAIERHIPITRFVPDWSQGLKGGPIRNEQMAQYADALIAVWDGYSRGTKDMISQARKMGLRVFIARVDKRTHEVERCYETKRA